MTTSRVIILLLLSVRAHGYLLNPKSTTGEVVERQYYTVSYNEFYEQSEWVAYDLNPEMILGPQKRTGRFKKDPLVSTQTAHPNDYRGSGYDRGHLAPAGDMKLNYKSMIDSFYMSNVSPQAPGFNRGTWRTLENLVRKWVLDNDCDCFVMTGPVLTADLKNIPGTTIAIAKFFYKIVYNRETEEVLSFLLPAKKVKFDPIKYATPIDDIEELTGIDFLPHLDDETERVVEMNTLDSIILEVF